VTTTVMIVDDQAVVRAGFRTILDAHPDLAVVGEASDGDQAVHVADQIRPDVVLMDVRMPGTNGIEATRKLAGPEVAEPVRVLVVTTFDLDEYVFGALRAGASGFLLKDTDPDELAEAVRVVASGQGMVAPAVTRQLIEEFARAAPVPDPGDRLELLTEREQVVLGLMARGWSNGEIADHLVVEISTVKAHVGKVLSKLEVRDRVQAVIAAYELGIVRPGTT